MKKEMKIAAFPFRFPQPFLSEDTRSVRPYILRAVPGCGTTAPANQRLNPVTGSGRAE